MWNTIAHWGGALALVSLYLFDTSVMAAIILLTTALGLNSGVFTGFLTNHIELAPNFAGTLMGITNSLANVTSILGPLLVGFVVTDSVRNTITINKYAYTYKYLFQTNKEQWGIIFLCSAAIFFLGNLFYIIFGTAETQPWNDAPKTTEVQQNSGDENKNP